MADFVAIDFETANENKVSACAIGIVKVENSQVVDTFYSLIRPPELKFDSFNVMVHGITEPDVEDEPQFNALWPEIRHFFEKQVIIAHYAPFDMGVLLAAFDEYKIAYPTFDLFCTRCISRKTWLSLKSYSLDSLADYLGISFNHHHAYEDALACAKVGIHACERFQTSSLYELADKLEISHGYLKDGKYKPCLTKLSYLKSLISIKPTKDPSEFDVNHPFYGKTVVFTGTLQSMPRKAAAQKVVDAGGEYQNTVNQDTDFLVMGIQDYSIFTDRKQSSKTHKAERLIEEGIDLEIIGEDEFIRLLGHTSSRKNLTST